jgi:hypothetical protein
LQAIQAFPSDALAPPSAGWCRRTTARCFGNITTLLGNPVNFDINGYYSGDYGG